MRNEHFFGFILNMSSVRDVSSRDSRLSTENSSPAARKVEELRLRASIGDWTLDDCGGVSWRGRTVEEKDDFDSSREELMLRTCSLADIDVEEDARCWASLSTVFAVVSPPELS